jgi:glutamyl-tRNA synthetase
MAEALAEATPPVGRFAPSPTGDLHPGSAIAALAAWASARSRGGRFLYRAEDLDGPRVVPGAEAAQMAALRRLGLDWDEGPDLGGPHAPYRQSDRSSHYEAALERLAAAGRLFPCRRSRKELLGIASAPHGAEGLPPYPAAFRPRALAPGWYADAAARRDCALRFRVDDPPITFTDRVFGPITEDVRASTGDFVLKRRDGLYAYQLAVVVDDLAMGVTEVVRGADLLDSTARQILLIRALGGTPPAYAHVPLLVNDAGEKLSKRDGALALGALFEAGVSAEAVVGWLAWALGQQAAPAPMAAADVAARWDWARVRPAPVRVPADLVDRLRPA